MLKKLVFGVLSIASLICIFQSCAVEDDGSRPVIKVIGPEIYHVFAIGDTVRIDALFSDNTILKNVKVSLFNGENKLVSIPVDVQPNAKTFKLYSEFVISDPYMDGGIYYLRFSASDGMLDASFSQQIGITEMSREFLGLVAIVESGNSTYDILRLPVDSAIINMASWSGVYQSSAISSRAKLLCIASSDLAGINAINYNSGKYNWSIMPQSNGLDIGYRQVQSNEYSFIVSCYKPQAIEIYSANGLKINGSDAVANSYPSKALIYKNYLLGYFKNDFSKQKYIMSFSLSGGLLLASKYIENEVVAMEEMDSDKIFVAGNSESNTGIIQMYIFSESKILSLYNFLDETIVDVCKYDSNVFILSTNKGIYRYYTATGMLSPISNNIKSADIECNALDGQIFASTANDIFSLDYTSGLLQDKITLAGKIVGFHAIYSK